MTVCCAILKSPDQGCWLGTDSQSTCGNHVVYDRSKHVSFRGISILVSGCALMESISARALRATFDAPQCSRNIDELIEEIRTECNRRGWEGKKGDGGPENREADMLITDGMKLYLVDSGFFPLEVRPNEFVAIGAAAYAFGAAYVAKKMDFNCRNTIELAIEAASHWCIYVGGDPAVWLKEPSSECRFE